MSGPALTLVAPPPPGPAREPEPRRRRWRPVAAVLAGATAVVAAVALVAVPRGSDEPPPSTAAAESFLDRYLAADGRVVRADEGGDTVSEGQAYAMLVAQAIGDRDRFDRAWRWARENLQRDDGLLSWYWRDGAVVDPMPAADADLDAAWALALAAERFDDDSYAAEAARIAAAVLDRETVVVAGRRVLVAGPWATRAPMVVNPSYVSPAAFAALGQATGDDRWAALADDSRGDLAALLAGGLPPDWAVLSPEGDLVPVDGPDDPNGEGRYGLDAARLVLRLGGACEPEDRELAAGVWSRLAVEPAASARTLDGAVVDGRRSAVPAMAAAVAASAAGDTAEADARVAEALRIEQDRPTYYGAAWVALGQLVLDGRLGC